MCVIKYIISQLNFKVEGVFDPKNVNLNFKKKICQGKYSVAIGFLNRWTSGTPIRVSFTLSALGLDHPSGYSAFDIFERKPLGNFSPKSTFSADVNPSGDQILSFIKIIFLMDF